MQPATDTSGGGSSGFRRWGPLGAIVVVLAVVAGLVIVSGGDDEDGTSDTTAPAGSDDTGAVSFSDAAASNTEVEWGDRCDTDTGRLAIPVPNPAECYAPFEGDNGGATADGVTADSIKIVVYQGLADDPILNLITDAVAVDDTPEQFRDSVQKWVDFLETYYETYGRTIDIEFYESTGISNDAVTARADAVKIAEDLKPFQVWGGPALTTAFGEELNARGIQCIACGGGDQTELNERDLYFGGGMTSEQFRAHNVEALAKQVAGRKAEFAGDPAFQQQERRFGYLYIQTSDDAAGSADEYEELLNDADVELAVKVPFALDLQIQETAASAIQRLKSEGVTTVIFAGDPLSPREFTKEATEQDYFPEWFLNISALVDTNAFSRTYDQEQWKHAFGLSVLSARVDPQSSGSQFVYEWFYGEAPEAEGLIGVLTGTPNIFFAALQEVGPNLTHDSFKRALFALEPVPGGTTYGSSSWGDHGRWDGIEGEDYEGVDDVTKIWWDPADEGEDELRKPGKGVWQFVDGGKRYLLGEWPEEEFKAFDPEGATGIQDAPPESETPKDYEPLPVKE